MYSLECPHAYHYSYTNETGIKSIFPKGVAEQLPHNKSLQLAWLGLYRRLGLSILGVHIMHEFIILLKPFSRI